MRSKYSTSFTPLALAFFAATFNLATAQTKGKTKTATTKTTATKATKATAAKTTAAKATPKPDAPKTEAPKPDAPKVETKAEAKNDPTSFNAKDVWDVDIFDREDHKVLVIQDRKYNKAGRLELGLDAGVASASPYYTTFNYGGHLGYHLNEYLGVEFHGAKFQSSFSANGKQLNDFFNTYNFPTGKEFRQPEYFMSGSAVWSPIYGKFAFFRSNIIYFDIYGQAGLSVYKTKGVKSIKTGQNISDKEKVTEQNHLGSLLGVGVRAFINERYVWRFDVRNNVYSVQYAAPSSSTDPKRRLETAFQFTTGISMLFNLGGF